MEGNKNKQSNRNNKYDDDVMESEIEMVENKASKFKNSSSNITLSILYFMCPIWFL
jgi:hypothetical protein